MPARWSRWFIAFWSASALGRLFPSPYKIITIESKVPPQREGGVRPKRREEKEKGIREKRKKEIGREEERGKESPSKERLKRERRGSTTMLQKRTN